MRVTVVLAAAALAGCGGVASQQAPVKRQPGSWGQTVQIVRLEGKGVTPEAKAAMQRMFDMFGKMTVCVTPEAAAREDIAENIRKLGGQGGECTIEKRTFSGETVDFAATCRKGDAPVKVAMSGKSSATAQDLTIKVEPAGEGDLTGMEMRVVATRRGECTADDLRVPDNAAAPAG